MKVALDRSADAIYLALGEAEIARTAQVAPGVILDYDVESRVIGVEMLSISKRAPQAEFLKLDFEILGTTEAP